MYNFHRKTKNKTIFFSINLNRFDNSFYSVNRIEIEHTQFKVLMLNGN